MSELKSEMTYFVNLNNDKNLLPISRPQLEKLLDDKKNKITFLSKRLKGKIEMCLYSSRLPLFGFESVEKIVNNYSSYPKFYGENPIDNFDYSLMIRLNNN